VNRATLPSGNSALPWAYRAIWLLQVFRIELVVFNAKNGDS
jgi:hypothetical protein